jgi:hypothetical protein
LTDDYAAAPDGTPDGADLLRLAPRVLRARGWRLYTEGGKRLVDLWQYGGRALLGHNPPGMLRTIKNSAERGLYAPFPHFTEGRLLKALATLFALETAAPPGAAAPEQDSAPRALSFRLYADEASLERALAGAAIATVNEAAPMAARVCRWRPFLEPPPVPAFVPVLPFPFPGAPVVLALDPALENRFPPSPPLSPVALAAAARCVWDLIATAPERNAPHFPKLDRVLARSGFWRRRGIYITPASDTDYPALFRRFLERGFLLPPSPASPAVLPGELSPGEEAKLAALLQECEM